MAPPRKPLARILMVHNYSSWGGNLATVLVLCRRLPERGYVCELAAPPDEDYVERFRAAGIVTHAAAIRAKGDVSAAWRYRTLIRRNAFDVVHTHTRRADFVAALGGRLAGARVVSTQHGQLNLDRHTLQVKRDFSSRFYNACLRSLFDKHVAVSAEIAGELINRCGVPAEKVANIPNGIDPGPFVSAANAATRGDIRRELGLRRWSVVVANVASLDSKGHGDLLTAASACVREGIDVHVLIAGEGQWGKPLLLEEAVRLGIRDRVHVLGFREDIPRVLAAADIFALPTPSEGLSIAILEAMAAGLPVITTPVGGNPELVREGITGMMVNVGDHAALVKALLVLARDAEKRYALGRAAQARVVLDYTADKMVDRYASLYGDLLRIEGRRV